MKKQKFKWLPEEYKNKKYKFIYLYDSQYSEPTIRKPYEPKKECFSNVIVQSYINKISVSDILLQIGDNSPEDYELHGNLPEGEEDQYSITFDLIKREKKLDPNYDKLFKQYQKELEIYKQELVDFKKIKKIWKEWAKNIKKDKELSNLLYWKKKNMI